MNNPTQQNAGIFHFYLNVSDLNIGIWIESLQTSVHEKVHVFTFHFYHY